MPLELDDRRAADTANVRLNGACQRPVFLQSKCTVRIDVRSILDNRKLRRSGPEMQSREHGGVDIVEWGWLPVFCFFSFPAIESAACE